jgi:hypothetical protein
MCWPFQAITLHGGLFGQRYPYISLVLTQILLSFMYLVSSKERGAKTKMYMTAIFKGPEGWDNSTKGVDETALTTSFTACIFHAICRSGATEAVCKWKTKSAYNGLIAVSDRRKEKDVGERDGYGRLILQFISRETNADQWDGVWTYNRFFEGYSSRTLSTAQTSSLTICYCYYYIISIILFRRWNSVFTYVLCRPITLVEYKLKDSYCCHICDYRLSNSLHM